MNEQEQQIYRRPKFDPKGRLVARRALTFGNTVYFPQAELPSADDLGIDSRTLYALWEQFQIDTMPRDEKQSAVPARVPKGKAKG